MHVSAHGVPPQFSYGRRDTVASVLHRILAICLGLISACYSPPQPDCGFACKRSGECPTDYFCAPDGICHREGTSPTAACVADARIDSPKPIDAPPPDADTTPPSVVATFPADGATNVPANTVIRVQFNEPVGGIGGNSFRVFVSASQVFGTINPIDPTMWEFIPTAVFPADASVTVDLTSAITDANSNALAPFMFGFAIAP